MLQHLTCTICCNTSPVRHAVAPHLYDMLLSSPVRHAAAPHLYDMLLGSLCFLSAFLQASYLGGVEQYPKAVKRLKWIDESHSFSLSCKLTYWQAYLSTGFIICLIILIQQSVENVQMYQNQNPIQTMKISEPQEYFLPEVSVCSHFMYDASKLVKIGLQIECTEPNVKNLLALKGIDMNMSAGDLVKAAAYDLQDMIHSVSLKDGATSRTINVTSHENWQLTFDQLMPCWKYSPPAVKTSNASLVLWANPKAWNFEECTWLTKNGDIESSCQYIGKANHSIVVEKCPNLCVEFEKLKCLHRPPRFPPIWSFMHQTAMGITYDISSTSSYQLSRKSVKVEQYVISRLEKDKTFASLGDCFQECLSERIPPMMNCHPLTKLNLERPMKDICFKLDVDKEVKSTKCDIFCRNVNEIRSNWRLDNDMSGTNPSVLAVISLNNKFLKEFIETKTYPLSKLGADLGSNAGLFLDVSLYSCLLMLSSIGNQLLPKNNIILRLGSTFGRYVYVILLSLMFIHGGIVVRKFIMQNQIVAFTAKAPPFKTPILNSSPRDWGGAWMAARSMGCLLHPLTEHDQCLSVCVLAGLKKKIPHYPQLYLSDIPACNANSWLNVRQEYLMLDSFNLERIDDATLYAQCSNRCNESNRAVKHMGANQLRPSLVIVYQTTFEGLICTLGGIVTLYTAVLIHVFLLVTDIILKSCLCLPYLHVVDQLGLVVKPLQVRVSTTLFNRLLSKWSFKYSSITQLWISIGVWVSLLCMAPSVVLLVYNVLQWLLVTLASAKKPSSHPTEPPHVPPVLQPVVPGINLSGEELPSYIFTLLVSSVLHEAGHAVAAVREGVHVDGVGLILLFIFPGAFVLLPADAMTTVRPLSKLKILCAGVWNNIALAVGALLLAHLLPSLSVLAYDSGHGAVITSVFENSPARGPRGLHAEDIIQNINGCTVKNSLSFHDCLLQALTERQRGSCVSDTVVSEMDETVQHGGCSSVTGDCPARWVFL
ncbi:Peptidase M50 [Trinorchestia longiramus]|nr:Peptidase M50 [Trinorchestia longiramus]